MALFLEKIVAISPYWSLYFSDIVSYFRRAKYHCETKCFIYLAFINGNGNSDVAADSLLF